MYKKSKKGKHNMGVRIQGTFTKRPEIPPPTAEEIARAETLRRARENAPPFIEGNPLYIDRNKPWRPTPGRGTI
jgi:hypothetical protein